MSAEVLQRPRTVAINYDSAMRYLVPSARDPETKYLVEVDAYHGNARCVCEHFEYRCEPLIKIGITPQQAIDQNYIDSVCIKRGIKCLKAIKLKVNRHVEDSLRCEHCITARSQFVDDVLEAIRQQHPERYREERP